MATSPLTRRLLSGALSAALLLGTGLTAAGCSDDGDGAKDIPKARFLEDFSQTSGLKPELSVCVVDELYRQLDQKAINDFYGADTNEPLSKSNQAALEAAITKCTKENLVIPTSSTLPTSSTVPASSTAPTATTAVATTTTVLAR